MNVGCGYWMEKDVLLDEQLVQSYEVCGRDIVVKVKDPLDGYVYPLCKRHWGATAKKAAKTQGLDVEEVVEAPGEQS